MPAFIPLGDFVERRRLVILLLLAEACVLDGAALSASLSLLIVMLSYRARQRRSADHDSARRRTLRARAQGKTIGTVLSGFLLGILLARTISGFIGQQFGWRTMFWIAGGMSLLFAISLRWKLPPVPAHSQITYPELIHSIWRLVVEIPKLRQVSFVAPMFFATFSACWTTLVFLLETPPYH
jgi:MFS family permease